MDSTDSGCLSVHWCLTPQHQWFFTTHTPNYVRTYLASCPTADLQYESHMAICPDSPLPAVGVARGWPARLALASLPDHVGGEKTSLLPRSLGTRLIWPKFREILGENSADINFWPPIAGLVGVMNIINDIAGGGSPCVRAPPSLAAEERMLWERSTYEGGVRWICMKMCCLGGKNLVVKGLMCAWRINESH